LFCRKEKELEELRQKAKTAGEPEPTLKKTLVEKEKEKKEAEKKWDEIQKQEKARLTFPARVA
jgi:hypothetical protein